MLGHPGKALSPCQVLTHRPMCRGACNSGPVGSTGMGAQPIGSDHPPDGESEWQ